MLTLITMDGFTDLVECFRDFAEESVIFVRGAYVEGQPESDVNAGTHL